MTIMNMKKSEELIRQEKLEALEELENWVSDLESGIFAQGRNALRRQDETFCCVGVLSQTFAEKRPDLLSVLPPTEDDTCYRYLDGDERDSSATVPTSVNRFFLSRGVQISWGILYEMNDGQDAVDEDEVILPKSFDEIAAFIRVKYIAPLKQELGLE